MPSTVEPLRTHRVTMHGVKSMAIKNKLIYRLVGSNQQPVRLAGGWC
jgi:hypothetical protein